MRNLQEEEEEKFGKVVSRIVIIVIVVVVVVVVGEGEGGRGGGGVGKVGECRRKVMHKGEEEGRG